MKYTTDIYDESIYSYSLYQDTSEMSSYSVDLSYNPYDSYVHDVFSKELEIQNRRILLGGNKGVHLSYEKEDNIV
jgi:hypothetical protein